jgi:GNAT superfamily N-acetyltransferase
VQPVTAERVEEWLRFFDHDGFADNPDWASCYCLEPHLPATAQQPERPWQSTRATMAGRLGCGATFGYLAYVEGRAAGWVNASFRSEYLLYLLVDPDGPAARAVIGVSCFVIAPPFRRHGVASALLERVIDDAPARGASWIEAYPHNEPRASDAGHFRGTRSMYDARGFQPVEVKEKYTVVRRAVR